MKKTHPFLLACRGEPTAVTPIWLMRQAGRYLPEYRAIRDRMSFLDLCKNSEAATEVTCQPVEILGVDAAILFADILLVLEPLGLGLSFTSGDGPTLARPLRSPEQIQALPQVDVADALGFVFETVRQVRARLADRAPLIGFAGAPFTLASYAIEGGGSRNWLETKRFLHHQPDAFAALMAKLVDVTTAYLNQQIAAGAQAVQVFDSWVGHLSPEDYRRAVLPHMRRLFRELDASVPAIHFSTGTAGYLELLAEAGGDVIGVDWRVSLADARRRLGGRPLQGNLDPCTLFAPPRVVRERAAAILDEIGGAPGHVFNLGHGVLPSTPVDSVRALVEAVHELSSR